MAGENYTFPMPTEQLKTQLEETRRKLAATEARLQAAEAIRCPSPNCIECRRWRAWEADQGDVQWLVCPRCQAGVGEPCRHAGRGAGRSYGNRPPVLRRPHQGRPWAQRPSEDLI
jgi:hypothetical protein